MSEYGKDVSFVFYCKEKESAELKIRLRYDGITQSHFFRSLLRMYINKDPKLLPVVEKIKLDSRAFGKRKVLNANKEHEKGAAMLENFGITEKDRNNIFDIILSSEELDE